MKSTKCNDLQRSCRTEFENSDDLEKCVGQSILILRDEDFTFCHLHAEYSAAEGRQTVANITIVIPLHPFPLFLFELDLSMHFG